MTPVSNIIKFIFFINDTKTNDKPRSIHPSNLRNSHYFGHIFIIIVNISYASSSFSMDARRSLVDDNSRFIYYLSCKIFYSWEPSKVQRRSHIIKDWSLFLVLVRNFFPCSNNDDSSNFSLVLNFSKKYILSSQFWIC